MVAVLALLRGKKSHPSRIRVPIYLTLTSAVRLRPFSIAESESDQSHGIGHHDMIESAESNPHPGAPQVRALQMLMVLYDLPLSIRTVSS